MSKKTNVGSGTQIMPQRRAPHRLTRLRRRSHTDHALFSSKHPAIIQIWMKFLSKPIILKRVERDEYKIALRSILDSQRARSAYSSWALQGHQRNGGLLKPISTPCLPLTPRVRFITGLIQPWTTRCGGFLKSDSGDQGGARSGR